MGKLPIAFRQFLYSKWFFGLLVIVSLLDMSTDLSMYFWGWSGLTVFVIGLDIIVSGLCLWIFLDLHRRRPRNGRGSGR